jgi:hypothetical protein
MAASSKTLEKTVLVTVSRTGAVIVAWTTVIVEFGVLGTPISYDGRKERGDRPHEIALKNLKENC